MYSEFNSVCYAQQLEECLLATILQFNWILSVSICTKMLCNWFICHMYRRVVKLIHLSESTHMEQADPTGGGRWRTFSWVNSRQVFSPPSVGVLMLKNVKMLRICSNVPRVVMYSITVHILAFIAYYVAHIQYTHVYFTYINSFIYPHIKCVCIIPFIYSCSLCTRDSKEY